MVLKGLIKRQNLTSLCLSNQVNPHREGRCINYSSLKQHHCSHQSTAFVTNIQQYISRQLLLDFKAPAVSNVCEDYDDYDSTKTQ